jgi:hypothetical protein
MEVVAPVSCDTLECRHIMLKDAIFDMVWPMYLVNFLEYMSFRVIDIFLPHHAFSQNMFFDITFCTGSGRRVPVLKFIKNSYGVVSPPVSQNLEITCFWTKCLFVSK